MCCLSPEKRGRRQSRFCRLEYRLPQDRETLSHDHFVIALLIEEAGNLRVFVDPTWSRKVGYADRDYIAAILSDFKSRIDFDPDAVFNQITSLNLGPLVTHDLGTLPNDDPRLTGMANGLQEL